MKEPSLRRSRLALAGGLAAAIVVGGGGFLLGRGTTQRPPPAVAPATPIIIPPPVVPTATPAARKVLGRAELITLAAAASDAAAAGATMPAAIAEADGERFDIRLPFGCDGPAPADSNAAMRWRYDADSKALRLHVEAVTWTTADWWTGDAPATVGAIEGFWIPRPWTTSDTCPPGGSRQPGARGADAVTLPGQVLALGRIFSTDDAGDDTARAGTTRDGRRGDEPYDTVVRIAEDRLDAARGFLLRVTGRIARVPGGGTVRCQQPAGPEQRPICLIGATIDTVAIENPATDDVLATWDLAERASAR